MIEEEAHTKKKVRRRYRRRTFKQKLNYAKRKRVLGVSHPPIIF
jgi:hypothetical protein